MWYHLQLMRVRSGQAVTLSSHTVHIAIIYNLLDHFHYTDTDLPSLLSTGLYLEHKVKVTMASFYRGHDISMFFNT